MSVTNPALLASLFITAVTLPFAATGDPATEGEVHVRLSDGSECRSGGFVECLEEVGEEALVVLRVALSVPGESELVTGPVVGAEAREMFTAVGVAVPAAHVPLALSSAAPADPTEAEIEASREIVERGNAAAQAALDAQAAATAPVPQPEPEPVGAPEFDTQAHINRLHRLLELAERELHAGVTWITKEMKVILHELGAHSE